MEMMSSLLHSNTPTKGQMHKVKLQTTVPTKKHGARVVCGDASYFQQLTYAKLGCAMAARLYSDILRLIIHPSL